MDKKKYLITHFYESEDILIINVLNSNKEKIAHANVVVESLPWVSSVLVYENYRRQGIATAMYTYAEDLLKVPLRPAEEQTPDAIEFWSSFRKK